MARRIDSVGVIAALADALCLHGIPEHIRCDDGPEMISKTSAQMGRRGRTVTRESLKGKLRDEGLKQEIFYSLKEAQAVIGIWQNTCNRVRPHPSLGYRPPAPVGFPGTAFRLPMAATMQ